MKGNLEIGMKKLPNYETTSKKKYGKVGVLPIRILRSNVSSVGPSSERNQREIEKYKKVSSIKQLSRYWPLHHGINMMCIYTNVAVMIEMAIVMATGTIMKSNIL